MPGPNHFSSTSARQLLAFFDSPADLGLAEVLGGLHHLAIS